MPREDPYAMLMRTHPIRSVVALAVAIAAVPGGAASVTAAADGTAHELHDALVLPRVGRYGRAALHLDAIEARIVDGSWSAPDEGEAVTGGESHAWRAAAAGDDGWLVVPELRGGYAYWTVASDRDQVMILEASGHSTVYANGEPRAGDPYGNGWLALPVRLRAGTNDFLFHVSRGRLRARLVEPKADVFFSLREPTLPDLVVGEGWGVHGGVVLVNAGETAADDLHIGTGGSGLPSRETAVPSLPPLSMRKVQFWFGGEMPPGTDRAAVALDLVRRVDGVRRSVDRAEIAVAVRAAEDRHKRTFISEVDGSVQYYAVTPMRAAADAAADPPALFLTLHGASVEGAGQAAVYRPKTWGHVVAPTNRRPFGFDWEDWGRLDAIEVLDLCQSRYGIDPDRTYLTGHSMGGHGTWHVGVTYPDRFAAIGPSAGWVSFWSYTGAARYEDASPIETMLRRATNPSDTVALSRNLLPCGVYILHGEKDDNVPVDQARLMNELLGDFHGDYAYHEEPGAGHWWGNRCCDWDPMFDFFRARVRPDDVDEVEFHTASPGVSASARWVRVEQQVEPLDFSAVTARLDRPARRVTAETVNVAALALDVRGLTPDAPVTVAIDGQSLADLPWPETGERLWLRRTGPNRDGSWTAATEPLPASEKGPRRYGPFKDAFRHRVLFVYGTQGSAEENAWAYAKARYDAETFWYRANGSIEVVADTAFDANAMRDRSVIVYGNADTNAAWSTLLADSPVQVARGSARIGDRGFAGDDLGCLFIRPRPGSDVASVGVVAGSGPRGMRLTDRLPYFVSGVGYPDCLLLTPEVLRSGAAGVRAAGFFGMDWSVEHGRFAWE